MHWTEQEFMSLDFETTGVDTNTARPVEVSLLRIGKDESKLAGYEHLSTVIDINEEIPEDAAKIHGITTERMRLHGKPAANIIISLASSIQVCIENKTPLVIFNAPYDWNILFNEAKRYNLTLVGLPMFLDPLLLDRHFDKYRRGSRQLTTTANHYNVALDGKAHSAEADALAAAKIMRRMIRKYPWFDTVSLEELQGFQAKWYEEWKVGIEKYWAKQGKLDQKVTTVWPKREE